MNTLTVSLNTMGIYTSLRYYLRFIMLGLECKLMSLHSVFALFKNLFTLGRTVSECGIGIKR